MANHRKTVRQLADEFESRGSLTPLDAQILRDAPRTVLPLQEIAAYLGGSIIGLGTLWILVPLFHGLNRQSIALGLGIVGCALLALMRVLNRRGERLARLGEVALVIAVGTIGASCGTALNILGLSAEVATLLTGVVTLMVGLIFATRTSFAGAILTVCSIQIVTFTAIGVFSIDSSLAALPFVVTGLSLIVLGMRKIGFAVLCRASGTASIVLASFVFALNDANLLRILISLSFSVALFALGVRIKQVGVITGGGLGVTFTTAILAGKVFNSQLLQGLTILVVGLAITFSSLRLSHKK
ncbi:MAG: hypothetical protein D4R44_00485 [Actinobacteria bacterium]|nr:MAG: hypothetical protein D4R44_00485 [Actinomycetota bacterium]